MNNLILWISGEFYKIQEKRALLTKIIASGKTAHTYARENNLPRGLFNILKQKAWNPIWLYLNWIEMEAFGAVINEVGHGPPIHPKRESPGSPDLQIIWTFCKIIVYQLRSVEFCHEEQKL